MIDKSKLELIGEIAQANNKNLELIQEINQLQSNWNSLREIIIKEINDTKTCIEYNIKNNLDYSEYKRDIARFEFILDKMNELERRR